MTPAQRGMRLNGTSLAALNVIGRGLTDSVSMLQYKYLTSKEDNMNKLREYLSVRKNRLNESAEKTGLSSNTLRAISRMNQEEIGGIRLRNYLKIKNELGVELLEK